MSDYYWNPNEWEESVRDKSLDKKIKDAEKPNPDYCSHEWVKYLGLNESFFYCKRCDIKRAY
jgi:hypothetical protein